MPIDDANRPCPATRRSFLKTAGIAVSGISAAGPRTSPPPAVQGPQKTADPLPWYRRTLRWGQTNITEKDPERYDIDWWRGHWRRTQVQGVIINAGGIVAYYPSRFPLQHRAEFLAGRDLLGELVKAAHQDGIVVLARMDSNRAGEEFYRAHPAWFAVDDAGKPYRAGELYVSCISSPYYDEYLPGVLREIIERVHPEGMTDNSWSGLGRNSICYCENCARRFRDHSGNPIPAKRDWGDPVYRQWIQWNYARRLQIWDLNNRTTRDAGGPDCLWVGMNSGSISGQCQSFRDYKEICRRTEIIMLDHQARSDTAGFQQNGETGKLIHGLLGWEKLIPESMAMYQAGRPVFRLSSKPEPEARMWMIEGFAGGIQPWWHHIGAYHEDRRMYRTAEPVLRWHKDNEEFLVHRTPIATVGVIWSQENTDFYGQDNPDVMVELPFRGMTQALIRARIPYLPVHADHVDRESSRLALLILPNLGAMSAAQTTSIRRFVEHGGGLIATGDSSLFDEWGQRRADFGLADLFGAHLPKNLKEDSFQARRRRPGETRHTYLRLTPEMRARIEGPKSGAEPDATGERHPALQGFDETDILPFGGTLQELDVDAKATVLMTFIPEFPIFPPETSWMREPRTAIPGLLVNTIAGRGRVAFLPADLDRRYGQDNLPDHGRLLANLARWCSDGNIPISVEGGGLIDCHLYHQPGRLILHLVNLTSAGTWRQPVEELIPTGPFRVRVRIPQDVAGRKIRLLVGKQSIGAIRSGPWSTFEIKSVLDHEVVVLE